MIDKWLEALEKAAVNPAPQPVPKPKSAGDPFLDAVLSPVLYEVEDEGAVDPTSTLVQKTQQERVLNAPSSRRVWRGVPEGELIVETELAKIIGARESDMHQEEQ